MEVGSVLLGKYRIERTLGKGGMGVVVAARHVDLDEQVAIKFLLADYAQNGEVVARFMREARAAARIKSDHVVRVSDVGKLPSGEPYMVMELLDGEDLEHTLQRSGPLPVVRAIDYVLEAIEAVAAAHAHRIVHRDLKPANLFLSQRPDGTTAVKVLDFGISKFTSSATTGGAMTRTQGIMGSPLYMSPEQLASAKDVDVRTDVWALGVIVHQLLTNDFPFKGDNMPQLVAAVFHGTPAPLRARRPDAPEALEVAVAKALEKNREARYANVAELARALAPFGSAAAWGSVERIARLLGEPASSSHTELMTPAPMMAPTVVASTALASGASANTLSSWGGTTPGAQPAPVRASIPRGPLVVGGAVVALAAIVFVLTLRTGTPPTTAPAASAPVATDTVATTSDSARREGVAPAASPSPVPPPSPSVGDEPPKPAPKPSPVSNQNTSKKKNGDAGAVQSSTILTPTPPPIPIPAPVVTAPNCSPPYYFDEEGIKHFKPGCSG